MAMRRDATSSSFVLEHTANAAADCHLTTDRRVCSVPLGEQIWSAGFHATNNLSKQFC